MRWAGVFLWLAVAPDVAVGMIDYESTFGHELYAFVRATVY